MAQPDARSVDLKPRSHDVTTGIQNAPARSMLRAIGMTDADWDKPQIGIASAWNEVTRASLVSREIITDSVECVMHAERLDGFVGLAGCDKSIPAMLMAAARLDLASVFVYNGSIMPGHHNGVALDITSVFEAVGAYALGKIDDAELS